MQRAATLDKGLDILEAIVESGEQSLGIRELARQLKMNSTTVHNLVWTLCARGYLCQEKSTRRFILGPAGLPLAGRSLPWRELAKVAEPLIRQCQKDLDESVLFVALHGSKILRLVFLPSLQALVAHEPDIMPERAYGTAVGKMLLSTLEADELEVYLAAYPPQAFTSQSLANPSQVRAALTKIRNQGFAETRDELVAGISAVAVLVEGGPGNRFVTALGASAPSVRFTPRLAAKMREGLQRYAGLIHSTCLLH